MIRIPGIQRLLKYLGVTYVSSSASYLYGYVRESFTGAWQRNIVIDKKDTLLRNSAVYACVTGISGDISKMRIKLDQNEEGIWTEITDSKVPQLAVLRKPNHYQNHIQFVRQWILSKLLHGNAYILIDKDNRNVVTALYPLDPHRIVPLIAPDGDVFYQITQDPLSKVPEAQITVPAEWIIHDRMACLFHPLVGIPPLYACALSATLLNRLQNHAALFFENRAMPGGMLTAPGTIDEVTATRLREDFEKKFSGENRGRLLVLGDGMKFEAMQMTAEHAQLAEQFKLSVEDIARAFHYPMWKLGGPFPAYSGSPQVLTVLYYTDCLQELIESFEVSLDEGLGLPVDRGTELDIDALMRMDTPGLYDMISKAVSGGGWLKPDEGRFKANLKPVKGGDTPYLQQQNYSLEALAKRDSKPDPFEKLPSGTLQLIPEKTKQLSKDDHKAIMKMRLRLLTSKVA